MTQIIIAIALFGTAGVVALVLTLALPTIMENMPAITSAKAKLQENRQRDILILNEIEGVLAEVGRLEGEVARWDRELRVLVERRNMFPKDQPLPILELGQPLLNCKLFECVVYNNAVIRAQRQKEAPPANPYWTEPRYVMIWSEDLNTARSEIVERFPSQMEWYVEMRGQVKL